MFDLLSDNEDDNFDFGNEDFLANILDTKKINNNQDERFKPNENSPVKGFSNIKFNLAGLDLLTPVPSSGTVESPSTQNIISSTPIIKNTINNIKLGKFHQLTPNRNVLTPDSCSKNSIPSTSHRAELSLIEEINTNGGKKTLNRINYEAPVQLNLNKVVVTPNSSKINPIPSTSHRTNLGILEGVNTNVCKRVLPPSPKNKWSAKKRLIDCSKSPNVTCLNKRPIPGPAGLLNASPNENTSPVFSNNVSHFEQNLSITQTIFEKDSWQSMMAEFGTFQTLMKEINIASIIDMFKANNFQRGIVPCVLSVILKEIRKIDGYTNVVLLDKTGLINGVIFKGNKDRENLEAGSALLLRGATIFKVDCEHNGVNEKKFYLSITPTKIVCVYQGRNRISEFSKQELASQMEKWMEESRRFANQSSASILRNLETPTCTRTLKTAISSNKRNHFRNLSSASSHQLPNSITASLPKTLNIAIPNQSSSSKDLRSSEHTSTDKSNALLPDSNAQLSKEEKSFMNDDDDFDKMFQNDDFDELMEDEAVDEFMANLNF